MQAVRASSCLAGAVVLAAFFPGLSPGQSRYDPANAVAKDDPIHPILAAHLATMQKREEEAKEVRSRFRHWARVDSPATAKLFPNMRFSALQWDMHRHPEYKGRPISLAGGLEKVLVIDATTNRVVQDLWCFNNHDEFTDLLVAHKVTLRDEAEAKLVWDAHCDIYGMGSKTEPMKKVSATEWHLGISHYDQVIAVTGGFKIEVTRTHYARALVDAKTGRITSWGTKVDTSNERKIPVK